MAYNEDLSKRINAAFSLFPKTITDEIVVKKMFGGLSFLYKNKMTVGIIKNDLAVRIITDKMNIVLKNKYVRPMDFTKKPMKEFIYVSEKGFATEEELHYWIELGLEHAQTKL
tara:strand:- start:190 stop:528 length:339 start_codon:yes stop_codon:yes gene_type:complete